MFILVISIGSIAVADTTYVAPGPVSGNWTAAGNPYFVSSGDIIVESGSSLTIDPGVIVLFTGNYKFTVQGLLNAEGSEQDSIIFTRAYPTEESKWRGFRFDGAEAGCTLKYGVVEYAKGTGAYPDVRGGGIWVANCTPLISHCSVAHNYSHNENYNGSGAGLFIDAGYGTIVEYCHIYDNLGDNGGGICVGQNIDMTIRYNLIEQNTVYSSGGGIYVSAAGQATIHDNVIQNNQSNGTFGGGGMNLWCATWLYGTYCTVYNNLVSDNHAVSSGGGVYHRYETSVMYNNTITDNTATQGGGVYVLTFTDSPPTYYNSIIYNNSASTGAQIYLDPVAGSTANVSYCDVQGGWTGLGNISDDPLFAGGPNGNYYLSQTAAGQVVQSPCVDAGNPTSAMIDGTTRTDEVQDEGVVDMGFHYQVETGTPAMVLSLDYVSGSPVPAGGGNLYFELYLENQDSNPLDFEGWIATSYEGGPLTILVQRSFRNYQPGWAINRPNTYYPIPGNWAAGNYTLNGLVGDTWGSFWVEDSFPFVKQGGEGFEGVAPYAVAGAPNPFDSIETEQSRSSDFRLVSAYPNPFNPVTTISYNLQDAGFTTLTIFNVQGREVATLVDGYHAAGLHEVTFDASELPSGIYIYRLEAGKMEATGKMMLIK